jgi:hypothetical protein
MFEAAIKPAVAEAGEFLRPLDWGELVARFGATRDMRALVGRAAAGGNSFAARASSGLPHDYDAICRDDQPTINLEGLEGMKPPEAKCLVTADKVAMSDQGTR